MRPAIRSAIGSEAIEKYVRSGNQAVDAEIVPRLICETALDQSELSRQVKRISAAAAHGGNRFQTNAVLNGCPLCVTIDECESKSKMFGSDVSNPRILRTVDRHKNPTVIFVIFGRFACKVGNTAEMFDADFLNSAGKFVFVNRAAAKFLLNGIKYRRVDRDFISVDRGDDPIIKDVSGTCFPLVNGKSVGSRRNRVHSDCGNPLDCARPEDDDFVSDFETGGIFDFK